MMVQRVAKQAASTEEARKQREEAEVRQAFAIFDIDGDGLIDVEELRLTMINLGEELSDDDIKAMMLAADTNGDGKVDFQGFFVSWYIAAFCIMVYNIRVYQEASGGPRWYMALYVYQPPYWRRHQLMTII